jgi:hypothetical protein
VKSFTVEQRRNIVQMHRSGMTCKSIAAMFHCGTPPVSEALRAGGINVRRMSMPEYVPTPEDIRAGMEEIQSTWDDDERERRAGAGARLPWMPPVITSPCSN